MHFGFLLQLKWCVGWDHLTGCSWMVRLMRSYRSRIGTARTDGARRLAWRSRHEPQGSRDCCQAGTFDVAAVLVGFSPCGRNVACRTVPRCRTVLLATWVRAIRG